MLVALLVSLLAGLATSVGGALALGRRTLERCWVAVALAFAAGAMILVSLVQILPLGIGLICQFVIDVGSRGGARLMGGVH